MHNTECTNQLIHETSPYLQQHARNPVDWYPWSKEAFEKARRENKPILLSIGYSACHWCHVMAHESFEDAETAKTMNALFVNIKVDREERPDLDKIYQNAYQLLNRRGGGWPLTMFLTPDDQVPFFGATYIPKEPRFGLPSFTDLMQRLIRFYRENENKVREQNDSMMAALIAQNKPRQARTGYTLNAEPLQEVCAQLAQQFDANQGGFSQAPKFPSPLPIERLLRHWSHTTSNGKPDRSAETMACFTLRKMALGGIYDHLGGGFFRYSVDDKWMIPHFEKMLYDNGPLLTLYSEAWQATGNPLFRRVCEETGAWVIREMQAPEGGYYSSFDADSEGEEGRFYVWTPDEVRKRLTPEEYAAFAPRYGLDREANFEDHWHLHVNDGPAGLASPRSFDSTDLDPLVKRARQKLLEERGKRVRPGRDEKVLTAWNGLMIKAMAGTGRRLDCAGLVESAERSLDFIRSHLWQGGRLLATYKDGQAKFNAYLDDYAFLIDGILELLQARWRDGDLEFAQTLADVLLEHFQDRKGGFYFTAENHEQLIQRPKPLYDDALPTGNGIAAQVLFKLGHLLSSMRYLVAGERTLKWAWPAIEQSPMPCNALLLALEEYFYPGQTVILRGQGKILESWRKRCSRAYAPRRLILAIPASVNNLPETLTKKTGVISGDVTAYLCAGTGCSPPITDLAELEATLAASEIIAG